MWVPPVLLGPSLPCPLHSGLDVGLIPYGRCMETEGHLHGRNPPISRALDIITLCKVGIDVRTHQAWACITWCDACQAPAMRHTGDANY